MVQFPVSSQSPDATSGSSRWAYALVDLIAGGLDLAWDDTSVPPSPVPPPSESGTAPVPRAAIPATSGCGAYAFTDLMAGGLELAPEVTRQCPRGRASQRWPWVLGMGGLALLLGVAGLVGTRQFVARKILPRLERQLSEAIARPIRLGNLESLSWRGIQIGETRLPATATTASHGTIQAIQVGLDWRSLFQRGPLQTHVTFVRPELYWVQPTPLPQLAQEATGATAPPASPAFSLASLRIREGSLTLIPRSPLAATVVPAPIPITALDLTVTWLDDQPQATVTVSGAVQPGAFNLEARVDRAARTATVQTRLQDFPLVAVNPLLPEAVEWQTGSLASALTATIAWTPTGSPDPEASVVYGSLSLEQGQIALGQLPHPITNLYTTLEFAGDRVTVPQAGGQLGDLVLTGAGTVDAATGYHLTFRAPDGLGTKLTAAGPVSLVRQAPHAPRPLEVLLTGPLTQPTLRLNRSLGETDINPAIALGVAVGMNVRGLPSRDRIPLIEGATYTFRRDGAWFTLSDGTVVPPLSATAFARGAQQLPTVMGPALDDKFFWFLQTNPYVTAIAADLANGKLRGYLRGQTFDTDRFFLEYFLPIYIETSRAAGLDPGEPLWMLNHALRTLQEPLLRGPDAIPITSGSGTVGSFWKEEQFLSLQQLLLRPLLAQDDTIGHLARYTLLQKLDAGSTPTMRRLSSTPETMTKIPKVTFGAEEGAIAQALAILQFPEPGMYPAPVTQVAQAIAENEQAKQAVRQHLTDQLLALATDPDWDLGATLATWSEAEWRAIGFGPNLTKAEAATLTGTNVLSILVSRSEKAGYPLEQAYRNSRALLLELLQAEDSVPGRERVQFALLKDWAFCRTCWQRLAQQVPERAGAFEAIAATAEKYRTLAHQGAALHESLYTAMVQGQEDVGVSAAIKQAVGFQAHLAALIDQALAPANPQDPRYQAFRRSLAIYLREVPDMSVYAGTEAAPRLYGQEMLNLQELIAVDVAAAPRIRAFARLYGAARETHLIGDWDVPGFQRILLTGALMAAGVQRSDLPLELREIGFPSEAFRQDLLLAMGAEGATLEATRLGVQAHDYRVSFQPVAMPQYRLPSFAVTDPGACPSQPRVQAIALGPHTAFAWNREQQRVVLQRAQVACPLDEAWTGLFFDTLLETVAIDHSEAGAQVLQGKLRQAQRLEAGIF